MKKLFILLLICLSVKTLAQNSTCDESDQCTYSFYLRDAFGDGWNGANLQVIQNGVVIETLILNEWDEETILIPLCKNIPFEIYWSTGGSFPNEVMLKVFDNNGIEIYNLSTYSSSLINTTLFTSVNTCRNAFQFIPFLDSNNNGIKDENEPNLLNGTLSYQVNNNGDTVSAFSYNGVFYIFPENETDTYDFSYSIYSEFVDFYAEPISFDDITFSQTESNVYYIPIVNTTPYNDVTVSLVATNQPAAGFNYINKIYYSNNGIAPASGTLTFLKDPALTVTNISVAGTVNSPTGFTFDYVDLMPSETRVINVTMSVPAIPTVTIGDLVTNSVTISSLTTDANPNNNTASETQTIVASYDPNDKNEAHGDKIALADFTEEDYLFYTIRFQNTGTTNATFVRVEDVLDAQLNPESLRMIWASHPFILERINNQLVWKFDNIQLVPQIVNENASIGFVHFKIKPSQGIEVGDIIPNTADIYFDFNPVIVTNTFETEFVENLSTPDFTNSTVLFSPNPTKDKLQIQLNGSDAIQQISIYDVVGKRIYFKDKLEINTTSVDFSSFNQGVYLVEVITTSNQKLVNKIIKQ